MLKDAEELIKRCKLTSLPMALHMNDYGRQVAPAPLALPLPMPLPLPLLAKSLPMEQQQQQQQQQQHQQQQQQHHLHHHQQQQQQQHHLQQQHPLPLPLPMLPTASHHSHAHASMHTTPPTTPPTPPPLPLNMSQTATSTATATSTTPATVAAAATTTTAAAAAATTHSPPATPTAHAVAAQDHYSLRWNNHQNHILRAFDALLQTKTLVDVTLVCAETSIRAHKMVLSACSPFFQRVFAETPCKHPVIVLKDFRGWVVQAIVDFMYRGEISVPQQRLQTLIQAGESLQVRGLVESSVPEHTPTPAASPEDFNLLDTSLLSSSFEDDSPSMVRPATAASAGKLIMPSRLFGNPASAMAALSLRRKREQEREHELESDQELGGSSPMPRRKQARPRRRSGDVPHDFALSKPETTPTTTPTATPTTTTTTPTATPMATSTPTSATSAAATTAATAATTTATTSLLEPLETLQTVIKHELLEENNEAEQDEKHAEEQHSSSSSSMERQAEQQQQQTQMEIDSVEQAEQGSRQRAEDEEEERVEEAEQHELDHDDEPHRVSDDDDDDDDVEGEEEEEDEQDIEELIHTTNELRRQAAVAAANAAAMSPCPSDGPEDLCTTKKDKDLLLPGQAHGESNNNNNNSSNSNNNNNNNNSSKLQDNNNQRIMLSLKDIRQLNAKPCASSTPTPTSCAPGNAGNGNGLLSFPPPGMRPPAGLPDSPPCHMEALEAQMHAAAAAAVAAAGVGGDHPFHHMEHQMEMSLAAAAAAAAMRDPRETREQALQREHNAFASNLLGPMGLPPFGAHNGMPGGAGGCGGGQAPHERLEESMNRLSKEFGKEFSKEFSKEFGKDFAKDFGKDFCKEFAPTSPMSLPGHFNVPDGQPHPPSPLPFPGMSSALTLTPPHMFGLDSPLGLFPPGIDPGKLYNPLMEMSDPRDMPGGPPPFLKKKMPRPKGQHSAPRGGPPRSWTNTELTEALQHVWNKKMTTSQASRIFGIPYNSLLMYVRGKYGKSLKLEQLRKDCISGPPIEMLQMGISGGGGGGGSKSEKKERKEKDKDKNSSGGSSNANSSGGNPNGGGSCGGNGSGGGPPSMPHPNDLGPLGPLDLELGLPLGPPAGPRSGSSEPDLLGGHNALFNPFNPQGFYPDFAGGFPGLPLSMLNLLPPAERHHAAVAMHHLGVSMDEDCKSVGSKQSSSLDDDFAVAGLPLSLEQRRHSELASNGGAPMTAQANGAVQD